MIKQNKFLQALFKPTDTINFLLIHKSKNATVPVRTKTYQADSINFKELQSANKAGYGVHCTINAGGTKAQDIKQVRACFFESDSISLEEQRARIENLPLKPSFTVRTRRSIHVYFLLKELSNDLHSWQSVQKGFCDSYPDCDKTLDQLHHRMRVPEFVYHKDEVDFSPFVVDIDIKENFPRYTLEQLKLAFPRKAIQALKVEEIKHSEQAFRRVVGNIPDKPKTSFSPTGLDGDSWMFYQDNSGWYLKRWSSGEALSIIDYVAQTRSLDTKGAIQYLIEKFSEFSEISTLNNVDSKHLPAKALERQGKESYKSTNRQVDEILNLDTISKDAFSVLQSKDRELDFKNLFPSAVASIFENMKRARAFPIEHLITMFLPIIASLCGKSKIVMKKGVDQIDSWVEPVNLFSFVLADSGSGKSPALKTFLAPLKFLQDIETEHYKKARKQYDREEMNNMAQKSKNKSMAAKFYGSSEDEENKAPVKKIFVSTGTTPEAVGKTSNPVGGILYKYDEAMVFLSDLIGYKQSQNNTTFWNCIWGAESQAVQRVQGDRELEGVAASLIALGHPGKTIARFKDLAGNKDTQADNEGIYARYLICAKEAKAQELPFDTEPVDYKETLESIYLFLINDFYGKNNEWAEFELEEDAQRYFWELRNLAVKKMNESEDPCLAVFLPKMLSNIGRIALVLHKLQAAACASHAVQSITLETLKKAIELGMYYFEQSLYVYKYGQEKTVDIELLKQQKLIFAILEHFKKSKQVQEHGYSTASVIKRSIRAFNANKTTAEEITTKYLKPLVSMGYLREMGDRKYERLNIDSINLESVYSVYLSTLKGKPLEPQVKQPVDNLLHQVYSGRQINEGAQND